MAYWQSVFDPHAQPRYDTAMTAYPRGRDPLIPFEDLRAGMVFVDAREPWKRVVILKVYYRSLEIWLCTVGVTKPRRRRSNNYYWDPITPHNKHRKTGFYLDPNIPGNTREAWKLVPRD